MEVLGSVQTVMVCSNAHLEGGGRGGGGAFRWAQSVHLTFLFFHYCCFFFFSYAHQPEAHIFVSFHFRVRRSWLVRFSERINDQGFVCLHPNKPQVPILSSWRKQKRYFCLPDTFAFSPAALRARERESDPVCRLQLSEPNSLLEFNVFLNIIHILCINISDVMCRIWSSNGRLFKHES